MKIYELEQDKKNLEITWLHHGNKITKSTIPVWGGGGGKRIQNLVTLYKNKKVINLWLKTNSLFY